MEMAAVKSNTRLSEGLMLCNYFVESKCIQEHKSVREFSLLDSVETITAFWPFFNRGFEL